MQTIFNRNVAAPRRPFFDRSTRRVARRAVGITPLLLASVFFHPACRADGFDAAAQGLPTATTDTTKRPDTDPNGARVAPDANRSNVVDYPKGAPKGRTAAPRAVSRAALQQITLFHGQARLLPISGAVRRIAIGNGSVVGATSVDDGVLLLGEQAGASSLIIWTDQRVDEFMITVSDQDSAVSLRYLQSVVRDYPGVTIEPIGDRFVVRGTVYHSVREELAPLLKAIPSVVNLLREQEGFPKKKTVHFKVQILELAKNVQQDLGILWDREFAGPRVDFQGLALRRGIFDRLPTVTDPADLYQANRIPAGIGSAIGGAFIGIASSITSRINLALNNGEATVLAAPEVSTASGGEARFLAGGQVPIVTSSFGGTTVEYKDYGIVLNIKPLIDADNNISASVETEVSQIDSSVSFNGFPAFLTRKSRSDVSLRPLETMVISGLVNSSWARAADKVPMLGDVPVLGRLFRSDSFLNKRTDLVIFVTPEVLEPLGDTNRALVQKGREIGSRIPLVDVDPRFTPRLPESTDISPAPAPGMPPPPVNRPQSIPAPIPGGPGVPIPLTFPPMTEDSAR